MRHLIILLLLVLSAANAKAQQPGTINTAFGDNGYRVFNNDTMEAYGTACVRTADGKIVIVGTAMDYCATSVRQIMKIIRVNADGTIDQTFRGTGMIQNTGAYGADYSWDPKAIVADASGNVFIAGTRTKNCGSNPGEKRAFVIRIDADGEYNDNFGNSMGTLLLDFPDDDISEVADMVLGESGNLVISGVKMVAASMRPYVAKIRTSDGTFVTAFGTSGVTTLPSPNISFSAMLYSPTGNIFIVGHSNDGMTVSSFNGTSGVLNASFGNNGIFTFDMGGSNEYPFDMVRISSGTMFICGYTDGEPFIAGVTTAGGMSNNFSSDGKRIFPMPETGFQIAQSICVYNGDLYALVNMGSEGYAKVIGVSTAGTLLSGFGASGIATCTIGDDPIETGAEEIVPNGSGGFYILANPRLYIDNPPGIGNFPYKFQFGLTCIDSDGDPLNILQGTTSEQIYYLSLPIEYSTVMGKQGDKVIVAMRYRNKDGDYDLKTFITRLNADGTTDPNFNHRTLRNIHGVRIYAYPDNRLLIAGYQEDPADPGLDAILIRLKPDGTLDSTFATNGQYAMDQGLWDMQPNDIDVDASGSIYLSGGMETNQIKTFFIIKLNANGSPDLNFNGNGYFQQPASNTDDYSNTHASVDGAGFVTITGTLRNPATTTADLYAMKLAPDASLSVAPVFSGISSLGGIALVGSHISFSNNTVLPDGKFYQAATSYQSGITGYLLARFNPDYSLDAGFGTNGFINVSDPGYYTTVNKLMLMPDGKPLLLFTTGDTAVSTLRKMHVLLFNTDGSPDNSFSFDGQAIVQRSETTEGYDLVTDQQQRIWVSGTDTRRLIDLRDGIVVQLHSGYNGVGMPAEAQPDVLVYPNPAADAAWIDAGILKCDGLTVTTIDGKVIYRYQQSFTGKFQLPLQDLSPGIYLLTLHIGQKSVTKKLIKQ